MTAIATHRNHHTGLRWCDDPVFAVWELSNGRMVGTKNDWCILAKTSGFL
ncbi:MAG: hypothetical protein HC896_18625 [Bacteroidales bacterium]|nr:hypothetical protein [Bacteroidales bacterium]